MDNKLNLVVQFSALDKLSGGLRNIIGLGRSGDQALRGMKRQARDLSMELKKAQAATAGATGNVTALIAKERQLEAALAGVNRQIERQQRMGAIDGTVGRVQARGAQLQTAGGQQMAEGGAAAAGLYMLARGAIDFDAGMTDVGIKLGLNANLTRKLGSEVIRTAQASNQLPANMLLATDALASAGLKAAAIPAMLDAIGKVGVAANADVADLAKTSASNMTNLGIAASDTGLALGIMAAAGKAGRFELKTMAQYFPALAARAKAFGQQGPRAVADLAAAAQIAAKAVGGDGEQAATNLENLLAKINMEDTRKKFGKMGVNLQQEMDRAMKQGMSPLEAITTITDQTLKKNGGMQNLSLLFGDMQAQNALLPMMQNMEEFRRIREQALRDAPQVMMDFARKSGDAKIQLQALTGGLQGAGIELGRALLPHMLSAAQVVVRLAGGIADWARSHPQLASALAQGVVYLIAFKLGIGAVMLAFGSVIGPMATAWGWFQKLRTVAAVVPALAHLGSVFSMVRNGALLMAKGVMRAGLMMLANPMVLAIVLIAAALAGLAYLVYTNWDKIKAAFNTGIDWLKGVFNGLPDWLKNIGSMMMEGLLVSLNPVLLVDKLLSVARAGVTAFKNFFGIKSPSRLFMQMGGFMTDGLARGVDRGRDAPLRSMRRLATGVAGAGSLALAVPALAGLPALARPMPEPGPSPLAAGLRPARLLAGPPLAAPAPAARPGRFDGPGAGLTVQITINQQPGEDAAALADRVVKKLEDAKRRKRRGSFDDDF